MFCGNCGNKIEDNAKFCPICGSPQQPAAPAPSAEAAVSAPVEPVSSSPAGDAPASAENGVQEQPVPEISAQSQMPSQPEMPAQPEVPVQTAAPAQGYDYAASQAAPVQENELAQQAASVQQTASVQQAASVQQNAFEQQEAYQPAAPEAPKKKKSKAGLIAGITAGAVVLGGAGVGYFCFHDDITHLIMGDKEYAKMINKSTFKDYDKFDSRIMDQSGTMSSYMGTFMKTSGNAEQPETEDMAETLFLSALDGYFGSFEKDIIPEGMSLETESTVNVKLGSVFALADNDTTRSVIDAINSSKITAKIANGETDLISGAVIAGGKEFISGSMYSKDGNVLIALPGITDKTLYIPKEKFDSVKPSEDEIKKYTPDANEIKRIREEIVKIYYDSFDTADIKFTDNTTVLVMIPDTENSISAKGNLVSVTFTGEQLEDMLNKCKDFLKNDEYLRSYFKEAYNIDNEKYEELFKQPENSSETKKPELTLDIEHLVDVHNNVLATRYKLQSEDGSGTAMFVGQKNNKGAYVGITAKDDLSAEISLVDKTENGKDGKAVLDIRVNHKDKEQPLVFGFDCDYSGKSTAKFLGDTEVPVGKYVVTLSEPDKFVESVKTLFERKPDGEQADSSGEMIMSGGGSSFNPESLINELKKLTITSDTAVEGDVLTQKLSVALGEIGSVEFGSRSEKKSETVTMPDTANSARFDNKESLEGFGQDISSWAETKINESGITNILGGISGAGIPGIGDEPEFIDYNDHSTNPHYAAYTPYMEYEADNTSSKIYDSLNEQVTDLLRHKEGLAEGRIKLYYKNGKPEVLENYVFEELRFDDIEDIDSVYAEILIDNRFSKGILGVTTVFTDDKNDLPFNLPMPGVFNYYDGVYPWESTNMIGDYVVGTYPYVFTGEPTTTEYPLPAFSKDELNALAYDIADRTFVMLDSTTTAEQYNAQTEDDFELEFYYSGSEWINSAIYENSNWTEKEVISPEFITIMLTQCEEMTKTAAEKRSFRAIIYFKDGEFVGTAAVPSESYLSIDGDYFPKAADFRSGTFAGWDSQLGEGFIVYDDDAVPVGTYSAETHFPLADKGNSADPDSSVSYGMDGTWHVTAIDGKPYRDAIKEMIDDLSEFSDEDFMEEILGGQDFPEMLVIINGNKLRLGIELGDEVETNDLLIKGQGEYKGKTAYELEDAYGTSNGLIVPGATDKTAQLIDTINDITMDIEWISAAHTISEGIITFGEIKSDVTIDDIAGKWHAVYDGEDNYLAISTNYMLANAEDEYYNNSEFILLNPRDDGFDGFVEGESPADVRIQYSAETDTLAMTRLSDEDLVIFERTEKAPPKAAYLGDWKVSMIEGQTVEDWAKQNNIEDIDLEFTFSIGEYGAIYTEDSLQELWTVFPVNDTSFNLAYDSSMFIEAKLSENGDEFIGTLRLDDSDKTMEYRFIRIS